MIDERDLLSTQIHLFGDILGDIIKEQEGPAVFDLVERIRLLSKAQRQGNRAAGMALQATVRSLSIEQAQMVTKAFANYFQLVNLAEERERSRILLQRAWEHEGQGVPLDETIAAAIHQLHDEDLSAAELQELIDRLYLVPVLTAHPTEAKRRTVLIKLNRIARKLKDLDSTALGPDDTQATLEFVREEISSLWQTDETRTRQLGVLDEVRHALYYVEHTLFDLAPELTDDLEEALARFYPGQVFHIPIFFTLGSWVGGDRDGNPFVTVGVTEETLRTQKALALRLYQRAIEGMYALLSTSDRLGISEELAANLEAEGELFPDDFAHFRQIFPRQPYRQKLGLIYRKLAATAENSRGPWQQDRVPAAAEYARAEDFLADLRLMQHSLQAHRGQRLASGRLAKLIRQVETFGFHLVTLDIRQHAGRHQAALAEVFGRYGIARDFAAWPEERKAALLSAELANPRPLAPAQLDFGPSTNETLDVFRTIRQAHRHIGKRAVENYIISMTRGASDVLAVLLMAKDAGVANDLNVIPLFETIADLRGASATMEALFSNPVYQQHLRRRGWHQQIMIGYSDSNKDGGYVAANWQLQRVQAALAEVCTQHGVTPTLFHGRGGTIARGGGPANQAILARPPESIRGRLKLTEQGEVVAERFGDPQIAQRYLEQVVHAVLLTSGRPSNWNAAPDPGWYDVMDELAALAETSYRRLIHETTELVPYFHATTPIDEIGRLNIGSRPARRSASSRIDDLRAIPWVFSWTQSRVNLPGWYGLGTALAGWASEDQRRWDQLGNMYQGWRFFRVLVDNSQMSLRKADIGIAELYADLAPPRIRERVFPSIRDEFQRTEQAILRITGQSDILDNEPWLQRAIKLRNPYVDPLNFLQVELMRRLHNVENSADLDELHSAILLTMNGIAAGLRNTG